MPEFIVIVAVAAIAGAAFVLVRRRGAQRQADARTRSAVPHVGEDVLAWRLGTKASPAAGGDADRTADAPTLEGAFPDAEPLGAAAFAADRPPSLAGEPEPEPDAGSVEAGSDAEAAPEAAAPVRRSRRRAADAEAASAPEAEAAPDAEAAAPDAPAFPEEGDWAAAALAAYIAAEDGRAAAGEEGAAPAPRRAPAPLPRVATPAAPTAPVGPAAPAWTRLRRSGGDPDGSRRTLLRDAGIVLVTACVALAVVSVVLPGALPFLATGESSPSAIAVVTPRPATPSPVATASPTPEPTPTPTPEPTPAPTPAPTPRPTPRPTAAPAKPTASIREVSCDIGSYTLSFKALVTNATSTSWNFGDSTGAKNDLTVSHTYRSAGVFTVSFTATGAGGSVTVRQQVGAPC